MLLLISSISVMSISFKISIMSLQAFKTFPNSFNAAIMSCMPSMASSIAPGSNSPVANAVKILKMAPMIALAAYAVVR